MVIDVKRLWRHLSTMRWDARRAFPQEVLSSIEQTVAATEKHHLGELRFVVEGALELGDLLAGTSPRERAIDLFSLLRVWDTERNSGVLVYLLLAERRVEIVADRGIHARVGGENWRKICRRMEDAFAAGRFEQGALEGICSIGDLLVRHFPATGENSNELNDRPVVL